MIKSYCNSYYAATVNALKPFGHLEADLDVDVAIIGGGFTGVATAVELAEKGVSVALLESNRIGSGASGRNGGQITGSLSGDKAMLRQFSRMIGDKAGDFIWNLRWRGHDIIRHRVEKYAIQCDLKPGHMHAAYKSSHIPELEEMYRTACAKGMQDQVRMVYGADVQNVVGTDIYAAGLINNRNMHVHPLNLCLGEANAARDMGAHIFENSKVKGVKHGKRVELTTEHGRVRADRVLIAGNASHRLGAGRLSGLLFPVTLGIVATEPLPDQVAKTINPEDIGVYDTRFVLDYYRLTADKRLLFGSGTSYSGRKITDISEKLRPAIEKIFPSLKGVGIEYVWQGQDGVSLNRIPQLGRVADNVFYAQGFSGHGIAMSHIVGEIMASAMTGNPRDFDIFANVRHWRLPVGRFLGNQLLAIGMWYFQQIENRR